MEPGPSGRQPANKDGKSSFRRVVESRAREVELAELARRKRRGKVISWSDLEAVLAETVQNVVLRGTIDPILDADALHDQTAEELRRVLAARQNDGTGADQARLDAERLALQQGALKAELGRQVDRLESEERLRSARLRLSEESLDEIRTRALKAVRQVVDAALAGGGDAAVIERLRRELPTVVDDVVARQRAVAAADMQLEQDAEISRLRQRIDKLNEALERTEHTLGQVLASKQVDHGIASVYGAPAGLDPTAADSERKQEFLQVVFVNNLLLRGREVLPEDMAGVNDEYLIGQDALRDARALRHGPDGAAAADALAFAEPEEPITDETAF